MPAGTFGAKGTQSIPSGFADKIPSIAFNVPDLEGEAKLELNAKEGGQNLACIESTVGNGKSVNVPAVSYVAAGIAAAALGLSALGALSASGHPGASTPSPGFTEIIFWFQGMAMNGMHSVDYPPIYRQFSKNFAFSTGVIPWAGMQNSIDNFRNSTGGNTTEANYDFLKNHATLIYGDEPKANSSNLARRAWSLVAREVDTAVNTTGSSNTTDTKTPHWVKGIQGYVEQYSVPESNTFMTVLLVFAIVIAAIVVGILLFKVILEAWAMFGKFPKNLTTFRKEYWRITAMTITNLIFLLYGVWTLYSVFQFTRGDSWAAKLLAGITLGLFTAILGWFTFRIWQVARRYKKLEGDASALYENKETWKKYKIFYENYKKGYWWLFVPVIVYMFAKGCVIAAGDGHGLVQTAGQLIIEAVMLILLLWTRPYDRKSGQWINIVIQVVRVLSVVCILIFVTELGVAQTTKTVTGVILIAVQGGLTLVLALLIAINAIITCVRENPHRRRRKDAEKARQSMGGDDALTGFGGETAYNHAKGPVPTQKRMSATGAYEPYRPAPTAAEGQFVAGKAPYAYAQEVERSHNLPHQRSFSQGSGYSGSPPPSGRHGVPTTMEAGRRYSALGPQR